MDSADGKEASEPSGHHAFLDKAETESTVSSVESRDQDITPQIEVSTKTIKLTSIYGAEPFIVHWKENATNNHEAAMEICENIKLVMGRFPEVKAVLMQYCQSENISLNNYNEISYESISGLVKKYNKCANCSVNLWRGQTRPGGEEWSTEICSHSLLLGTCASAFNRAVPDVSRLNKHYEAFSSEVYGETSYEQLQLMLNYLKPTEKDVFVDLGSGVGHLVCYVAGGTKVKKAIGIEKARFPSTCAQTMENEFRKMMRWHGKRVRPFNLVQGDFLDKQFRDLIRNEATIIFINNFAFTSELETKIKKEIIEWLNDGTRIISTKGYARNKQLTERDMSDVAGILDVEKLPTVPAPASWTGKDVPYYLHTVNRKKLEEYFARKKEGGSGNGSGTPISGDSGRRSSNSSKNSQRSSSRESSASKCVTDVAHSSTMVQLTHDLTHPTIDSDDIIGRGEGGQIILTKEELESISEEGMDHIEGFGMTTRRKWNEYVTLNSCQKPGKRAKASVSNYGEVLWNEEDIEYMPPSKRGRPVLKEGSKPRGRPKKGSVSGEMNTASGIPSKVRCRLSEEAKICVDEMHEEIVRQQNMTVMSLPAVPTIPEGAIVLNPTNPLDLLLINIRQNFIDFLALMQTETFRSMLLEEVRQETSRRTDLLDKVKTNTLNVEQLLASGVATLKARLGELDMSDVETPSELLNRSKQIVTHHKDITQKCSLLEAEVASLEGRVRSAVPYGDRLVDKIDGLDVCLLSNPTNPDPYLSIITQACLESGCTVTSTRMESENETITQEGMLSPGCAPSGVRRPRQRPRVNPTKRGGANTKPEETSEEMERQIQEIVQKALKVESAVKEKERRARGTEKKTSKASSSSSGLPVLIGSVPVPSTVGSSSDQIGVPLPRTAPFSAAALPSTLNVLKEE